MADTQVRMGGEENAEETLPPLTAAEEKMYGRMGSRMKMFHDGFKRDISQLYELADKYKENRMSLHSFMSLALDFKSHLTGHHDLEEAYIFPILAKKMPAFRENQLHKKAHKGIHDGLDALGSYIGKVKKSPESYDAADFRAILDSFKDVLLRHLDEEVEDLSAENMRKYWTPKEMKSLPG